MIRYNLTSTQSQQIFNEYMLTTSYIESFFDYVWWKYGVSINVNEGIYFLEFKSEKHLTWFLLTNEI
jgi:hypothetical protein